MGWLVEEGHGFEQRPSMEHKWIPTATTQGKTGPKRSCPIFLNSLQPVKRQVSLVLLHLNMAVFLYVYSIHTFLNSKIK